jgi:hypothetical protein
MGTKTDWNWARGSWMRVVSTGQVARVREVDIDWARLYPHKGPLLILDTAGRTCYSFCELEPITPNSDALSAMQ